MIDIWGWFLTAGMISGWLLYLRECGRNVSQRGGDDA